MDMDSGCVYEDKTVIHELSQGLQMAQQLRVNLHSPEARDFYIQMILFSYEKALCVLRSGLSAGQPPSPALSAPNLPESSISFGSPGSEEFEFDQHFLGQQGENVISKRRKGSPTCEDAVIICSDNPRNYGQKDILGAKFPRSNYGSQSASPPQPSPERHEITPNHHQLSPPSPGKMLSNLTANLSVNTSDLSGDSDNISSSFSFPSTSSGLIEGFPTYYEDELLPIFSPTFISPVTSESNIFTMWGSSQSLDSLDADFEFNTLLEG